MPGIAKPWGLGTSWDLADPWQPGSGENMKYREHIGNIWGKYKEVMGKYRKFRVQ